MNNTPITVIIFIALFVFSTHSNSELFKWVDQSGKIHYSDKKPEDESDSKVVTQKSLKTPGISQKSSAKAIIRPYEKTARKILLLNTLYSWRKESESNKSIKIGAYYIGKSCSSRGAMKVPDVYLNHKSFFPKESQLASRIRKVINSLDYDADVSTKYKLIKRLRSSGGLSLHSEIFDLDFNSCAPGTYKSDRLKPVGELSAHRFQKHRIKLKIRWTLKSNRDQDIQYEVVTSGSYHGWNRSNSAQEALGKAVETATFELLSDKKFIHQILVKEDTVSSIKTTASKAKPIERDAASNVHKLSLNINEIAWNRRIEQQQKIGSYLFGDRCSAQKNMSWSEANRNHKNLFPKPQDTSKSIIETFKSFGYTINLGQQSYSLQAELLNINYNACAPSLNASNKYKDKQQFSSSKLTRSTVSVTIKWILKNNKNKTSVYQTSTQGFAGSLLTDAIGSRTMLKAISNATERLLSEETFISKITQQKQIFHAVNDFPRSASNKTAISRPADKKSEKLFLISNKNAWHQLKPEKAIGIYAYGNECVPYMDIIWQDTINDYPKLYPARNELLTAESNVIKGLDYKHQITDQYNVLKLQRKLGGFSLTSTILDLRFDSCTPNLSYDVVMKNKYKLSNGQFKRHRASVKVKWQLVNSTQNIIFETITMGAYNSWQYQSKPKDIIKLAVEDATTQLFSQQSFINHIVPDGHQQADQEDGFMSRLIKKVFSDSNSESEPSNKINNQYLLQAHLGQVLVFIAPLKISMEVHYVETGEWADNIEAIGFSHASLNDHKEISDLSIQGNGSILVELKDIFGRDKMIQLTPVNNINQYSNLRWDCSTNLKQGLLPMDCSNL